MTQPRVLNIGQENAAKGFFEFLFSDEKEMCISGPGGVGKTFLMGYLIDTILPQYELSCELMGIKPIYQNVVMTATTNKASEVLSVATSRPTSTVHSFFNLTVKDDYVTGKQTLGKSRAWVVHDRTIVFVDEASMVDSDLRRYILEGTVKCKIVYVGDHCQMAPIMETLSPVYRNNLPFYELTEPVRNAGQPALQALCSLTRDTVETGNFHDIQIVPGIIDHLDSTQMEEEINRNFVNQEVDARILAYTNKRVIDYNNYIRDLRKLPAEFQVGEHLVNNVAIRLGQSMLSVEEQVTIVDAAKNTSLEEIEDGVSLEVRYSNLENSYGEIYVGVPIPVDMGHYKELLAYYQKRKNWQQFFLLKNTYPDLRQRDASTVYKAQGSSIDTVYIDLNDLSTCRNPSQAARMLYVAVSRARKRIVFYGELAEKYGRLIK